MAVTGTWAGLPLLEASLFRVWTNRRCLAVTKREKRLDRFAAAADASARRGWPGFVLAHLALYVAGDMSAATGAVNDFLEDAGRAESFVPAAMTTVRAVSPVLADDALARVRDALLDVLAVDQESG